jgi:hypothetical protein
MVNTMKRAETESLKTELPDRLGFVGKLFSAMFVALYFLVGYVTLD